LLRASGELLRLEDGGMVLGMFDGVPYAEGHVDLGSGDVLVVYSDGVTETWNKQGEEFGETRVADVIRANRTADAPAIESAILRELERFAGGAKATDDTTLIVLKRH
jgi:sigma-B regulation protein RsbU (phosphoserine phosphatase)